MNKPMTATQVREDMKKHNEYWENRIRQTTNKIIVEALKPILDKIDELNKPK